MPGFDIVVRSPIDHSPRVRQLAAMFDVPLPKESVLEWKGELPVDGDNGDWNVGLIVGPSGSGKTTLAREIWGLPEPFEWRAKSVIDDFPSEVSIEDVSRVCQAVGFNTIPAWMRPFHVLSNGEQFRVTLARHLIETGDPMVVDEFSSVVDRQVAKIASHAVQKHVRRAGRRFVAVTCHYDVEDWLQPDWVFDVSTSDFHRRRLRCRPKIECQVQPVDYQVWHTFAPFHYLKATLNRNARCFALLIDGRPVSFAGMLHRPVSVRSSKRHKGTPIWGCSRLVTLPDWQGLGLAFVLIDNVSAAYKTMGARVHTYPAHPALIRSFDRSRLWHLEKVPGQIRKPSDGNLHLGRRRKTARPVRPGASQGRPCATFCYFGPAMERENARRLLGPFYTF